MKRILITIVFLSIAGVVGWGVYKRTSSQRIGLIVTFVGAAASLAPIFISQSDPSNRISSKVNVKKATQAEIRGISYSGKKPIPSSESEIKSEMKIENIEGGSARGIDWNESIDEIRDQD